MASSVGTQWTPGSASAAADHSYHGPKNRAGMAPLENLLKSSVNTSNVGNNNVNHEVDVTLKAQTNSHKETVLSSLQKNAQNQKDSEKFRLLDLISDHEKDEHVKSSPSEFYAAYTVEGMGKVQNRTPKVDKAGLTVDQHDKMELPPNVSFSKEPDWKNVFPQVPDFVQPNKTSIYEMNQESEPLDDSIVFLKADRGERLIDKGEIWSTMCTVNSRLKSLSDKISSKKKAKFLAPDCNVDSSMDMLTVSSPLYSCGWELEKSDPIIQSDISILKESDSFSATFNHQSMNSGYQINDFGLFDDAITNENDYVWEEIEGGNAEELFHFGTSNNEESGMGDSSSSGASSAGASPPSEKLEKLMESASMDSAPSSVDTVFGKCCSQFPSSPTSPILNLPKKSKRVGSLKEPFGAESLFEDIQGFLSFQKASEKIHVRRIATVEELPKLAEDTSEHSSENLFVNSGRQPCEYTNRLFPTLKLNTQTGVSQEAHNVVTSILSKVKRPLEGSCQNRLTELPIVKLEKKRHSNSSHRTCDITKGGEEARSCTELTAHKPGTVYPCIDLRGAFPATVTNFEKQAGMEESCTSIDSKSVISPCREEENSMHLNSQNINSSKPWKLEPADLRLHQRRFELVHRDLEEQDFVEMDHGLYVGDDLIVSLQKTDNIPGPSNFTYMVGTEVKSNENNGRPQCILQREFYADCHNVQDLNAKAMSSGKETSFESTAAVHKNLD